MKVQWLALLSHSSRAWDTVYVYGVLHVLSMSVCVSSRLYGLPNICSWTGYAKLPLGQEVCVNVCVRGSP